MKQIIKLFAAVLCLSLCSCGAEDINEPSEAFKIGLDIPVKEVPNGLYRNGELVNGYCAA